MSTTLLPAVPPPASERSESVVSVPFSLFEGDLLNRIYVQLGLGTHRRFYLLRRSIVMVLLTWVPVAILAWRQHLYELALSPINYFADFAAYVQFLVALPLFIAAERIVDVSTREAAEEFIRCGVIHPDDIPRVEEIHAIVERARKTWWSDAACVLFAYVFSFAILVPEFGDNPLPSWHAQGDVHARSLTAAGVWEFFIALPLLNYTWLRFIWKILIWCYYLYRITRLKLELYSTHPDLTGGLGFISETQGRFAVFILAYGLSNIAATVGYEIVVLDYDLSIMPVWGPLVGFTIGAPLLFTLPLFMFTKQLFRTKRRALAAYRARISEQSRRAESYWQDSGKPHSAQEEIRELTELTTLGTLFQRIERMRVVPFDLRSFGQLVGSTLGSIATLLPLLHAKGEFAGFVEMIGKLFGHMSGGE
ncbi:MAG TPA: hypothetical protein VEN29_21920 [Casimicrobiaceae bacterium]|nr:hypothetical protein [Casimicrobiaceae bacterium]